MIWQNQTFITLKDIYVAYRKAKKEAFFDTNCAHGRKFADFEQNLTQNLENLLASLKNTFWSEDVGFIGNCTFIPKRLQASAKEQDCRVHFCVTNPLEEWTRLNGSVNVEASYRLVIDPTVNYMILAALWIMKVGHKYDERLDSRFAVGNRLNRTSPEIGAPSGAVGKLNEESHSLFAPYFSAYGQWRQNGLNAIKTELEKDQHIVAITMDLSSFYHKIDPSFMLNQDYLNVIGSNLTEDETLFTRLLVKSIETWRNVTDEKPNSLGIPVGLSASCIIANSLLYELDAQINHNLMPAYYSRYVDDLFLVLRPGCKFKKGEEVLQWLANRLNGLMVYKN